MGRGVAAGRGRVGVAAGRGAPPYPPCMAVGMGCKDGWLSAHREEGGYGF